MKKLFAFVSALLIAGPALAQGQPQYTELKPPQSGEADPKKIEVAAGEMPPLHVHHTNDEGLLLLEVEL